MVKLYNNGYKKTAVREQIFKLMKKYIKEKKVVTIKEIEKKYLKEYGQISLETLYNNIYLFEKYNDFSKVVLDNRIYYYLNKDNICSHKAICVSCHKFFDLNVCPYDSIVQKIDNNVEILKHNLTVEIICSDCKKNIS